VHQFAEGGAKNGLMLSGLGGSGAGLMGRISWRDMTIVLPSGAKSPSMAPAGFVRRSLAAARRTVQDGGAAAQR
jgi:hypothetical protein